MTRKDYELIAKALADGCPEEGSDDFYARYETWRNTVEYVSFALFLDNLRFDHSRFLIACGIEE